MSEKPFQDSTVSISAAIILGAAMIAGSVLWMGGHISGLTTVAPSQAQVTAKPAVDASKVKISGEPFIGNPNAPTIAYWFDYQCPYCKQNEASVVSSIVSDYVNTGKVKIVFKDFAFLGPDSGTLAMAAHAVWDVDPNNFYAWHKAMFNDQGQEGSGWASKSEIVNITTQVLGASEAAQVKSLMTSKATIYQSEMDADKAEGTTLGVTGTPAMIIGKQLIFGAEPYSVVKSAIDQALK